MDDERVDIVNEQDAVVDMATKTQAHAQGLLHRIVHVLVFNQKGEIALQTRAAHKQGGGLLDASVGGHVLPGESYEDAARREMKEELGLTLPLALAGPTKTLERDPLVRHVGMCFSCVYDGPFQTGSETASIRFYTLDEVRNRLRDFPGQFTSATVLSLRQYLK